MSVDPIARGLAAKTRSEALGSAFTQSLVRAARTLGFYPRAKSTLAAADTPALSVGVGGAASTVNGRSAGAPMVGCTDARITHVSGPASLAWGSGALALMSYPRGAYYGAGTGPGGQTRAAAYCAYEFIHTGTQFDIPVHGGWGNAGTNFRVLVNDAVGGTLAVPVNTGVAHFCLVTFPTPATRRIRIEMFGLPANGVNVASSGEVTATGRAYPLMTMIGDSFLEGTGAEVGDIAGAVMGRALGCSVSLAGVGGTGLLNSGGTNWAGQPKAAFTHAERLRDLTLAGVTSAQDGSAADPDLGVVFASTNDEAVTAGVYGTYGATLPAAITNRCEAVIDAWVAARPGKPLVFFGPTWYTGTPSNAIYQIRDGVAEAAWGRAGANVWFIDRLIPPYRVGVRTNAADQAALYTAGDGVHPSSPGHRHDGLRDAAALRSLILGAMV